MSGIPSNLARVPNMLATQTSLSGMTRTSINMLRVQEQLLTGRSLVRPSDDAVRTSIVLVLENRLAASEQRSRNMQHATALLNTLDQSLADARELATEAHSIASSQVGIGSDAATRANQAVVIDSILQQFVSTANRKYTNVHVFSGSATSKAPIEPFLGGYRYTGRGDGMRVDIGEALNIPVTLNGEDAFGALSARVKGAVDLDPRLTRDTLLSDVRGALGLGVNLGLLEIEIDDGVTPQTIAVDLAGSSSVDDVLSRIESAIRDADPGALNGAYPSADVAGQRLSFDIAAGYGIEFRGVGTASIARDLGIDGFTFTDADNVKAGADGDLDPRLTELTRMGDLDPVGGMSFGDIVFKNDSLSGTVTINADTTIAEFKALVEGLNLGIRIEIGADGRSLDAVNEVSGMRMAIEEGGGDVAAALGIRSFMGNTRLSDFNDGRGVEIAHGRLDPVSGLPDPARNVDFRVFLTDGSSFDVDLVPGDTADVATLLAKINSEAAAAGFGAVFTATLSTGSNGIVFEDTLGGPEAMRVQSLNGRAAEDLGLLEGEFTGGATATFAGSDRAKVRVNSIFTTLIDLRDALTSDDQLGITLAGEWMQEDTDRLVRARALVGARSTRIEAGIGREQDLRLLDERIRSELVDVDYTEAATRFSLLELTQQAGLSATARALSLTLLDFLR
ncbi:MAG: hypothetical protein EA379_10085 [Phycisphaerales bacterium]|nr:MAG: hypothetical protein EA379_10085 [Phycisphaerales bacterium]